MPRPPRRRSLARRSAAALLAASILLPSPTVVAARAGGSREAGPAGSTCTDGMTDRRRDRDLQLADLLDLARGRAVAVGANRSRFDDRVLASTWWDGTRWRARTEGGAVVDSSFIATDGRLPGDLWAVGFHELPEGTRAIAQRWAGAGWRDASPVPPARVASMLTGVGVDPRGGVWATGSRIGRDGERGSYIVRRSGSRWQTAAHLPLPSSSGLTGIVALGPRAAWAVGSGTTRTAIVPVILRWNGAGWARETLPDLGAEAVLTAIGGARGDDLWAVGWRSEGSDLRPLVLHRDDAGWSLVDGPAREATLTVLLDLSFDADGRPWVVGADLAAGGAGYEPFATHWDGSGWQRWTAGPGQTGWLEATAGDPMADGWVVQRIGLGSALARLCETPAPAGGRGTHRPGGVPGLEDEPTRLPDAPAPAGVRPIEQPARRVPGLVVRDRTDALGLRRSTMTHGAAVGDLDDDGRPDLFISGHTDDPMLYLRTDAGYVRRDDVTWPSADRHDCAIGRLDPGPLPDVVCVTGAGKGLGLKLNELYLDPGSGPVTTVAAAHGIADPVGRGRAVALFDADDDGDTDLYLGNLGIRYDGLPSPGRLFRNDGTGALTFDPRSGLTSDDGAWCALPRDIDGDGDRDLVVCGTTGEIAQTSRLVVYRNNGGVFRDATRALGVRPIGEVDAEVAQLGGSDEPDLVQLGARRIRVSIWQGDRYEVGWERRIEGGRAVAAGDANGDGALDLYLQRGDGDRNPDDLLLINDGTGRRWTPVAIPDTHRGRADDVVALDADGNGRDDFLVLNGLNGRGPLQLLASYAPGEVP